MEEVTGALMGGGAGTDKLKMLLERKGELEIQEKEIEMELGGLR